MRDIILGIEPRQDGLDNLPSTSVAFHLPNDELLHHPIALSSEDHAGVESAAEPAFRKASWLTSFTDLVGLLLACFVLIYSVTEPIQLTHDASRKVAGEGLVEADAVERWVALPPRDPATTQARDIKRFTAVQARLRHMAQAQNSQFDVSASNGWHRIALRKNTEDDQSFELHLRNIMNYLRMIGAERHLIVANLSQIDRRMITQFGAPPGRLIVRVDPHLSALEMKVLAR